VMKGEQHSRPMEQFRRGGQAAPKPQTREQGTNLLCNSQFTRKKIPQTAREETSLSMKSKSQAFRLPALWHCSPHCCSNLVDVACVTCMGGAGPR